MLQQPLAWNPLVIELRDKSKKLKDTQITSRKSPSEEKENKRTSKKCNSNKFISVLDGNESQEQNSCVATEFKKLYKSASVKCENLKKNEE